MTEDRFKAIEQRLETVETAMSDLANNTAAILKVVGGASQFGRLIKVHGPRVFAAIVGWAIATGKIDEGFANMLRQIFLV